MLGHLSKFFHIVRLDDLTDAVGPIFVNELKIALPLLPEIVPADVNLVDPIQCAGVQGYTDVVADDLVTFLKIFCIGTGVLGMNNHNSIILVAFVLDVPCF